MRALLRAAVAAVLLAFVASLGASPARAADDSSSDQASAWSKFMQTIGLKKPPDADDTIKYTERSPLVVPPTRDLAPPMAAPAPTPDWPKDPVKPRKRAKSEKPPEGAPVMNNPNPVVEKKSWYNPATWFSNEEYAPFTGEPPRAELTDPPAGYRTPSPNQPYGIGPDKKGKAPSPSDLMLTPATPSSGGQSGK